MPTVLLNLTESSLQRVFDDETLRAFSRLGDIVRFDPSVDAPERFAALLADADAVVTCWGSRPVTAADIAGRTRPLLIAHAAGSVRPVASKAILSPTVRLTQSAWAMAPAVAECAVALLILALRQAGARIDALRARTPMPTQLPRELTDLRVGIVGLSRVGQTVAPLLAPFGPHLVGYDPYAADERFAALGIERCADLDTLLSTCDAITLHAPVTDETRGMIDARRVGLIKDGAALVNTARSAILDQEAVFARALAGEITYYTDVTEPEPLPVGHPALQSPNILVLPHIAGASTSTSARMCRGALDEVTRWLEGRPLVQEVTAENYDRLA